MSSSRSGWRTSSPSATGHGSTAHRLGGGMLREGEEEWLLLWSGVPWLLPPLRGEGGPRRSGGVPGLGERGQCPLRPPPGAWKGSPSPNSPFSARAFSSFTDRCVWGGVRWWVVGVCGGLGGRQSPREFELFNDEGCSIVLRMLLGFNRAFDKGGGTDGHAGWWARGTPPSAGRSRGAQAA